jgi:hypothetical protein
VVLFEYLVLSSTTLGELKANNTTSQLAVDLRVGVESVVNTATLLLVQDDLHDLAAVLLGAETLANNLDGEDQVGEDGVVNRGEGSAAGTLLGLGCAGAVGALGAGEDAAGGEDQDMAVRELLLELTGETVTLC